MIHAIRTGSRRMFGRGAWACARRSAVRWSTLALWLLAAVLIVGLAALLLLGARHAQRLGRDRHRARLRRAAGSSCCSGSASAWASSAPRRRRGASCPMRSWTPSRPSYLGADRPAARDAGAESDGRASDRESGCEPAQCPQKSTKVQGRTASERYSSVSTPRMRWNASRCSRSAPATATSLAAARLAPDADRVHVVGDQRIAFADAEGHHAQVGEDAVEQLRAQEDDNDDVAEPRGGAWPRSDRKGRGKLGHGAVELLRSRGGGPAPAPAIRRRTERRRRAGGTVPGDRTPPARGGSRSRA